MKLLQMGEDLQMHALQTLILFKAENAHHAIKLLDLFLLSAHLLADRDRNQYLLRLLN